VAASPRIQQFATLSTGSKALVLLFLLVALSAGYYGLFHMGLDEDIQRAERTQIQLQASLVEVQNRNRTYQTLQESLSSRDAVERQHMRILPVEAEIPAFLADLLRDLKERGVIAEAVRSR
jgi:Tfp pilus assembly protein PilO